MQKHIAVLITCHNRKDKTLVCLDSLFNCVVPQDLLIEVFLVDDGSTDGTRNAVKQNYPLVNIIGGNGNLYWNRGMHKAWKIASETNNFDYYLWLNDDTVLFDNALVDLLKASVILTDNSIIVASTCSKENGTITYGGFSRQGLLIHPSDILCEAHTFNGNCVLIPKMVFEKVGNIDPLFHHAIGDIDYGLRALNKGIKSYIAPGFLAYCEGHATLPKWCLKETPLKYRLKSLYSPLGNSQPYYYFRFELRHYGIIVAFKHLISIHLRMLLPQLWKN